MDGDVKKAVGLGCLGVGVIIILVACIGILGPIFGWFGKAVQVVEEQVDPHEMLRKYEWFKDASAQLDAKTASIKVYEGRFDRLKQDYDGAPRSKWSREDREQSNLWEQEVAGIRASYNDLAASYNAAHAKINWRFCDQGQLPQGADKVLPREYRTYEEK